MEKLFSNILFFQKSEHKFPVLVFIHGGAFEFGSAFDFGYEFFAENYASRDLIVVTVQYRLAQFGRFIQNSEL